MEINIERIRSRFDNKIRRDEVVKVYKDFRKIDDVLKLKMGIEESIVSFFKGKLNIELCKREIENRKLEIKKYENELYLLKRESFDDLRRDGKLMSFLWNYDNEILENLQFMGCVLSEEVSKIKLKRFRRKRDENNRNYNDLNLDGNVSVSSNSEVWR